MPYKLIQNTSVTKYLKILLNPIPCQTNSNPTGNMLKLTVARTDRVFVNVV